MLRSIISLLPAVFLGLSFGSAADESTSATTQPVPVAGAPARPAQSATGPLCFSASRICIGRKSAAEETPLQLQLTAHDRAWLMAELDERFPAVIETAEEEGLEVTAPPVYEQLPSGIAALVWAARNPAQSWRILLPRP